MVANETNIMQLVSLGRPFPGSRLLGVSRHMICSAFEEYRLPIMNTMTWKDLGVHVRNQ